MPAKQKILIVDDDTNIAELISLYLTDTVGNGATDLALQYGLEYPAIMMVGLIPFAVNQSYATNIKETGQTLSRCWPALWRWVLMRFWTI